MTLNLLGVYKDFIKNIISLIIILRGILNN